MEKEAKQFLAKSFILDNVGAGSFGQVYKAVHKEYRTTFAIKVLKKPLLQTEVELPSELRMCLPPDLQN
jgi:serine/threonine protein kinase